MAVTPASFKSDFDEFNTLDDAKIQIFLNRAALRLDESAWGKFYDEGLSWLTAYLLDAAGVASSSTGQNQSKSNLPTKRKKVDGLEIEYFDAGAAKITSISSPYNSSHYGRQFLEVQSLAISPVVGFW